MFQPVVDLDLKILTLVLANAKLGITRRQVADILGISVDQATRRLEKLRRKREINRRKVKSTFFYCLKPFRRIRPWRPIRTPSS